MTTDRTHLNARISAAILSRVASGESMKDAYDAVFGAGAYEELAGQVYEQLRAKQGLSASSTEGGADE